jgi:hypothetical protein
MRGAVAAFAVAALGLGAHLKSSAPPPPESALDKGLALAAAQTPHGIGSKVGDRRRLTRADRLAILRAQLTDPHRNRAFDAELRGEIERLERRLAVTVANKGGT